jgi:hypothetical protein
LVPAVARRPGHFDDLSCIGPRIGDGAITVWHLDQWQGLRIHDLLLADDAAEVEEIGGHRPCRDAYCDSSTAVAMEVTKPTPGSVVLRRQPVGVVALTRTSYDAFELGGQLLVELQ